MSNTINDTEQMNTTPKDYCHSPKQVAKELSSEQVHIAERTITEWCNVGYAKALKIGGRWFISDNWLQEKLVELEGREN